MRKKIQYFPRSFLLTLPIFTMSMIVLSEVFLITIIPTIIVSLAEWVFAANSNAETDYLQDQINELKKEKETKK